MALGCHSKGTRREQQRHTMRAHHIRMRSPETGACGLAANTSGISLDSKACTKRFVSCMHLMQCQVEVSGRAKIGKYYLLRLLHEDDIGIAFMWHTLQSSG